MKIVFWFVGVLLSLFIVLQALVWWQDNYSVLQKTVSPDGERVGLLIGNHGGGGAGYCRDLVYNFPSSSEIPKITSNWAEWKNEKYLVKVVFCDSTKKLEWKNKELTWVGKGSIPDY
jgi:hypothetical protein